VFSGEYYWILSKKKKKKEKRKKKKEKRKKKKGEYDWNRVEKMKAMYKASDSPVSKFSIL
jgi:hypothetical protein